MSELENKRILILGNSGTGKSTLSITLSKHLHLPVYHLDKFFWKAEWIERDRDEFAQIIESIIEKEEWIIDGNYLHTLIKERIDKCDQILFLDYSVIVSVFRVIKRYFRFRGRIRKDICTGCPEQLSFTFLKWVWSFNKRSRLEIIELLSDAREKGKDVHIFKSSKKLNKYLNDNYHLEKR